MIGPISLEVKQMGARSAGKPHAACDVEGAGNVAQVGLFRRARAPVLGPYLCGGRPATDVPTAIGTWRTIDEVIVHQIVRLLMVAQQRTSIAA